MAPIDAILEAAKTFESTRIQLEKLKSERDGVASQLQQQKQDFQSSTKDKRVGLRRKIKSITESFHQEEAILEAKLAELRQKHEKEVSDLEYQLDAFRQQFEDATGPLCTKQQEIDEKVNEREQLLQQLEQRLLGRTGEPTFTKRPLARTGEGEPAPKKRRAPSALEEHPHMDFPTVILFEGAWCELACFVCATNTGRDSKEYFDGWVNLRKHVKLSHPEEAGEEPDTALLRRCVKRRFGDDDAARLRGGQQPAGDPIEKYRSAVGANEELTLADSPFAPRDLQNNKLHDADDAVKRRPVSLEVGGEYGDVKASTPDPEPIAMPSKPLVPDPVDPKKRKTSAPALGASPQSSTTPKVEDDPTRRQSLTSINPSLDPRRANRRNQSVPSSLSTPMPVPAPAPSFAPKTDAAPAPMPADVAAQNRYKFDSNARIAAMARAYADSPRPFKSEESSPRKKLCQGNGETPHDLFRR